MTELGRRVLVALAVVAVALAGYLALPFAEALLLGAVLASTLSPNFERLADKLGGRRTLAGGLVVAGVIMMVVLPIVVITLAAAQQAEDAFSSVRGTFQAEGLKGVVAELPPPMPSLIEQAIERLPRGEQQVEELLRSSTGRVLGGVGYFFVATGSLAFQTAMMLVAFFFLLVDGPALVAWLTRVSPLADHHMTDMLNDFRDVSVAVLVGSIGTALVQTVVAFLGFVLAGAPHTLLLAAATFVGAFIPVVGAGTIVVLAALVLFFSGHSGAALFLAIWGVGVVASIDNFVKPYLMRGRMEVNGGVIFFALLGGAATFGPVGLLAGPLIVAFFLAVVRMCQKELQSVESLEPETRES